MKLRQEMMKFQNGLKIIDEKGKIKHQLQEKILLLKLQMRTITAILKACKHPRLPLNDRKPKEV